MTVVQINAYNCGSTGKIMLQLAEVARNQGHTVYTFSSSRKAVDREDEYHRFIDNRFDYYVHMVAGMVTGYETNFSYVATKRLIRYLDHIGPDIVHLHITHGFYLNHPLLFNYLKKKNVKVVWTLHDCWSFTGRCPHFQLTRCNKWVNGCEKCVYDKKNYPASYFFDKSQIQWKKKRKMFATLEHLTLVTPSHWLATLIKESFLKNHPVYTIHNGIDLSIFHPTESNFREKYNCSGKFIVLGVAANWGKRKGLDVFIELSKRLDKEKYCIVMVGTNDNTDKLLPKNIISIHRTQNQKELAEIYTAVDLFVNPTREDTYPTVNMESIACGTPVLTFRTGGSPEILDETCGSVVDCDDIDAMEKEIVRICENKLFSREACLMRAQHFDMTDRLKEYVTMYEQELTANH